MAVSGCAQDDSPSIPPGQSLADPTGGHGPGGARTRGGPTHSSIHATIYRGQIQDGGARQKKAAGSKPASIELISSGTTGAILLIKPTSR